MPVYLGSNEVCTKGGTKNITGGVSLQNKTVTPSESAQSVKADSSYDGLGTVTVNAISSTYVGSGITQKSAQTYTPDDTTQTISSGQYLAGTQTISPVPTETKSITANGTYAPTSGKYFSEVTVTVPSSTGGIDTSNATATASDIASGKTAYVNGELVTGTIKEGNPTYDTGTPYYSSSVVKTISIKATANEDAIIRSGSEFSTTAYASDFGDAKASDVISGKTFTSYNGLKLTGTHECSGGSTPTLQSKSVTPSESSQIVTPDSGYDGLSSVSVGAISSTYIGSGVTKKSAQTYTPSTSNQTIASGQYLSGAQTIKGDANLVAGNIKSGVSIFGVAGSYAGSSSSGSSMTMKSGTTTSSTIDTGLSSISAIVIYKSSFSSTGLIQGVYVTSEDTLHYTYCSSYSTWMKSCSVSTSAASSVSGGTFTLGTSGTSGLSSSTTYYWIAFGEA